MCIHERSVSLGLLHELPTRRVYVRHLAIICTETARLQSGDASPLAPALAPAPAPPTLAPAAAVVVTALAAHILLSGGAGCDLVAQLLVFPKVEGLLLAHDLVEAFVAVLAGVHPRQVTPRRACRNSRQRPTL